MPAWAVLRGPAVVERDRGAGVCRFRQAAWNHALLDGQQRVRELFGRNEDRFAVVPNQGPHAGDRDLQQWKRHRIGGRAPAHRISRATLRIPHGVPCTGCTGWHLGRAVVAGLSQPGQDGGRNGCTAGAAHHIARSTFGLGRDALPLLRRSSNPVLLVLASKLPL